jgi:hypothetical protein
MFNLDLSLDSQLRPRIRINRQILLFPRFFLEGEYEYRADLGYVNTLGINNNYESEMQYLIRGSYMLSRNFSIQGNYTNKYGWGAGMSVRF